MRSINPAFLILGDEDGHIPSSMLDPHKSVVHVVSRIEINGTPLGTPFVMSKKDWDKKDGLQTLYQIFPPAPNHRLHGVFPGTMEHLTELELPSIVEGQEVHYVDFYDFTWIDQIKEDLKTRPAVTFVSQGNKHREDLGKNLVLTAKEFKEPTVYGYINHTGGVYFPSDDEIITSVSFIDPRYVLPMFRKDFGNSMAVNYRLVGRYQAREYKAYQVFELAFILTDDIKYILNVDGGSIGKVDGGRAELEALVTHFSSANVFSSGSAEKMRKKKVVKARKNGGLVADAAASIYYTNSTSTSYNNS